MLLGVVTQTHSESHGVQGVAGSNPAVPTRPPRKTRGPCRDGAFGAAARLRSRHSRSIPAVPTFATRGRGFLAARLALLIDPPFPSAHVSGRDDSDQSPPDCENDCQLARCVGLSQGGVPWLALRVFDVWRHQEWAVEEHLLALSLGDLVQVPVLVGIAGVPLKTGALSQVIGKAGHTLCIC